MLEAERYLAEFEGVEYADVLESDLDCDPGAPLPHVIANSNAVHLAYFLQRPPRPGWHGESAEVVTSATSAPIALVTFEGYQAFRLGGPNDEAINGHPLYGRGLAAYRAHQVRRSSWIAELEGQNSVHPSHQGGWAERLHHYLIAFHDELFECVARSYVVKVHRGSMAEAVREVASRITLD